MTHLEAKLTSALIALWAGRAYPNLVIAPVLGENGYFVSIVKQGEKLGGPLLRDFFNRAGFYAVRLVETGLTIDVFFY